MSTTPMIKTEIKKLSVTVNVRYDLDLSRMYFDEFINEPQIHTFENNKGIDYIVIASREFMQKPYFKKSELTKMRKADLIEKWNLYSLEHYEPETRKDLIESLKNFSNADFYKNLYENERWQWLPCDFVLVGNTQGDAVKVNILENQFSYYKKEYLENLFFNSPLKCTVTITNNETDNETDNEQSLYIDQYINDEYMYYTKDGVLPFIEKALIDSSFAEYKDELLLMIDYQLPKEAEYI